MKQPTKESSPKGMCFDTMSNQTIERFYEKYPQYKKKVPKKKLKEIYKKYTNKVQDVLLDGHIYKLPENLGIMQIVRSKGSKKAIDWHNTKKMWEEKPETKEERKYIYFQNLHTRGEVITLNWYSYLGVRNKSIWKFQTSRPFRRNRMNKVIKDNPRGIDKYISINNLNTLYNELYPSKENKGKSHTDK